MFLTTLNDRMRYVRIFLLYFQEAFAQRGRSFIWFLIALLNPLVYFTFWSAASDGGKLVFNQWSLSSLASYYFLLIIAASLLEVHIDQEVAFWDIQRGNLTKYLLQPFSYFWLKFYTELSWRIIQGVFGIIVFFIMRSVFGNFLVITQNFEIFLLSILVTILAYILSYVGKMVIGLSAFWFTDYRGFSEFISVIILLFSGYIVPIEFFPLGVKLIAQSLPFAYSIYYPILAWQGRLTMTDFGNVIAIQCVWICILYVVYHISWKQGVREYTAIGQ